MFREKLISQPPVVQISDCRMQRLAVLGERIRVQRYIDRKVETNVR